VEAPRRYIRPEKERLFASIVANLEAPNNYISSISIRPEKERLFASL